MKSLSAFNTTAADNPHVDIVRLCKIEFSGLTLYLCDRVFGTDDLCAFDSQTWEPIILDWATVETGAIEPIDYKTTPGSAEITLDNNTPIGGVARFATLFATYDPHYTTITISDLFVGASAEIDIFKGQIENIRGIAADQITLVCSSFELDLANKFPITICDSTTYAGADPDDLGKMIPKVWGQAKKVPCIAIDAGGKTTIIEDMTDASPGNSGTLDLTDGSAFPSGAFILQVEAEQISIASRSGNTVTLAAASARAYGGTTAAAHDAGSHCAEIQTNYYYCVADHPVKAIDDVYVDNVRVDSGDYTAYTGQTGDNDPSSSYDGMAIINFATRPVFEKQVNVTVSNGTLDVDEGSHSHGTYNYTQWFAEGIKTNNDVGTPDDAVGSSMAEFAFVDDSTDDCSWDFVTTKDPGGTPDAIKIGLWLNNVSSNTTTLSMAFYDSGDNLLTSFTTTATGGAKDDQASASWVSVSGKTWAQISGGYFKIDVVSWDTAQVNVYYMWLEVRATPTASAATDVALTGSVSGGGNSTAETVIGSRVSADVDGYQDTTGGTYTGSANALIERPDHILHHMLVGIAGLAAGDVDTAGTYSTSGTSYNSGSYALAVVVLQRPNFRELINRIAYQSKSIEFWESGIHHLKFIEAAPSTDKTIEAGFIDLNQAWIKYTDRIDIINTVTARYARDWSGYSDTVGYSIEETADRATVGPITDSGSITKYGTLEGDALALPYITTSGHATAVATWRKDELSSPHLVVEFSGGYYLTDIERGDVIEFAEALTVGDASTYLADLFAGLVTMESDQFRVLDVSRTKGGIYIQAVAI